MPDKVVPERNAIDNPNDALFCNTSVEESCVRNYNAAYILGDME